MAPSKHKVLEKLVAASVDSNATGDSLETISTYKLPYGYFRKVALQVARLRVGNVKAPMKEEMSPANAVIVAVGSKAGVKKLYVALVV